MCGAIVPTRSVFPIYHGAYTVYAEARNLVQLRAPKGPPRHHPLSPVMSEPDSATDASVLLSLDISLDDGRHRTVDVRRGESPGRVSREFGAAHGLSPQAVDQLAAAIQDNIISDDEKSSDGVVDVDEMLGLERRSAVDAAWSGLPSPRNTHENDQILMNSDGTFHSTSQTHAQSVVASQPWQDHGEVQLRLDRPMCSCRPPRASPCLLHCSLTNEVCIVQDPVHARQVAPTASTVRSQRSRLPPPRHPVA